MKSLFMLSAAESAAGNLASLPLMTKGLLTTFIGLLGVFLVLGLFFLTIKLMQHIKTFDKTECITVSKNIRSESTKKKKNKKYSYLEAYKNKHK